MLMTTNMMTGDEPACGKMMCVVTNMSRCDRLVRNLYQRIRSRLRPRICPLTRVVC